MWVGWLVSDVGCVWFVFGFGLRVNFWVACGFLRVLNALDFVVRSFCGGLRWVLWHEGFLSVC